MRQKVIILPTVHILHCSTATKTWKVRQMIRVSQLLLEGESSTIIVSEPFFSYRGPASMQAGGQNISQSQKFSWKIHMPYISAIR